MPIAIEHDAFVDACDHAGIERRKSEAAWHELATPPARRGLSQSSLAAVLVGMILLSAANVWWATLIEEHAGTGGLAAFGFAWTAVFVAIAELGRRRDQDRLAAAFGSVAVAYLPLGAGAALDLAGADLRGGWLDGRASLELITFAAAVAVVYRYREPIMTMLPATLSGAVVLGEAIIAPWGTDHNPPAAAGALFLVVAAALTTGVLVADRRRLRLWAFWPALAADAATIMGVGLIAAASLGTVAAGCLFALAGIVIGTRGLIGGRLAQIAVGAVTFWVGALMATSEYGSFATAGVLTLAGATLIGGTVLLVRRRDLLERQRR